MAKGQRKKALDRQPASATSKSVPAQGHSVRGKSAPQASPVDDWFNSPFQWSGRYIDHAHDGSWHWRLSAKESRDLLCTLEEMGAKTWREITLETAGRNGRARSHKQSLDTVKPAARTRLEDLQIVTEELYRVRISSACRLWGYRQRGVLYLLWHDAGHAIYDG